MGTRATLLGTVGTAGLVATLCLAPGPGHISPPLPIGSESAQPDPANWITAESADSIPAAPSVEPSVRWIPAEFDRAGGVARTASAAEVRDAEIRGVGSAAAIELAAGELTRIAEQLSGDRLRFDPCADRDAVAAVRTGLAPMALVATDLTAVDRTAGLDSIVLVERVIGFVVGEAAGVRAFTSLELRRLLAGATPVWSRLGGRDTEVEIFHSGSATESAVLRDLILRGRELRSDRIQTFDTDQMWTRFRASPGGLAIVDLAHWSGPAPATIDGVAASVAEYRAGRYPFGVRARLVFRSDARGTIGSLVTAVRSAALSEGAIPPAANASPW